MSASVIPIADALIAYYEGDYEGTLRLMAEARSLGNNFPPFIHEIRAAIELGRTDEALAMLERGERSIESATKGDRFNRLPTYGVSYWRGRAHEAAGDSVAALEAYRATLALPGNAVREIVDMRDTPDRIAALEAAE